MNTYDEDYDAAEASEREEIFSNSFPDEPGEYADVLPEGWENRELDK